MRQLFSCISTSDYISFHLPGKHFFFLKNKKKLKKWIIVWWLPESFISKYFISSRSFWLHSLKILYIFWKQQARFYKIWLEVLQLFAYNMQNYYTSSQLVFFFFFLNLPHIFLILNLNNCLSSSELNSITIPFLSDFFYTNIFEILKPGACDLRPKITVSNYLT